MTLKNIFAASAASLMLAGIIFDTNAAGAASRAEIKRIVVEEARGSRVPTALALAVARVESDFDERALSSAGARGVMQIMPSTAKDVFGVAKDELWNARLNVQLGIDYLEKLYRQYGGRWELALSHYNGGTLKGGRGAAARPHDYTKKYVADVLKWRARYADQARVWQVAGDPTDADGVSKWSPASGRAVDVISDDWESPRLDNAAPAKTRVSRIVVREIPDRNGWERAGSGYRTSIDNPDFRARLRRAHRNLDDFSANTAVVRWREG